LAERRTITVHTLGDERVHLALAHLGRLEQGRLLTLCGKLAVTQLSPFAAAAAKAADRCRTCFGKVDDNGLVKAKATAKPSKERPTAQILPGPTPKATKDPLRR
jgi:hypothetical protein